MKSSSGAYYVGLDHVRALAVLLVWTWHFIQIHHIPTVPIFPLSILAEGHSGVAIFMTLSGYLFAKLLAGKRIHYPSFIVNRIYRLVPLLLFMVVVVGLEQIMRNGDPVGYVTTIAKGLVLPTLPNGGWSITVEFHFYLLLPILLMLQMRWKYALIVVLVLAVMLRALLFEWLSDMHFLRVAQYQHVESMQHYFAFFTIIGRIDQFLLGIIAYQFQAYIRGRHAFALATAISFLLFQAYFDSQGGYDTKFTSYWIILPTIEGLAFGLLIAWYDTSIKHSTGRISRLVAATGTYSYSIYLLHFFVVWELSALIHNHVCDLSNIYVALFFGLVTFPIIYLISSVTYRVIELPFLAYRKQYIIPDDRPEALAPIRHHSKEIASPS